MTPTFNFPVEKNYFLVPAMPTPNGRIHLGHIAGPYLKMDVLKRKVQRGNGLAWLCCGADVYESYVELKATQLNAPPGETVNHFYEQIVKDFKALDIEFDLFINPLDENIKSEFIRFQQHLLQQLINTGHTVEREESVPYDEINQRYLTGCWLQGICPNCNNATGSYLCEKCGYHYRPQDIFNKKNDPNVRIVPAKCLYLKLDAEALLENAQTVQKGLYKKVIEKYLELQGPFIRLTTLQQTGIPFEWDQQKEQVIFTYTGLLFYSIFCGQLLQKKHGLYKNPLSNAADTICCAGFGIDNVVPYLVGVYGGGLSLKEYRPFDFYFVNFFYNLNGEKFSTSRLHVIWSADIVERSAIQPDAVRYFLCKVNPENGEKNFDTSRFIATINNDLYKRMNNVVNKAFEGLKPDVSYELDEFLSGLIEAIIHKQNQYARPERFQLSALLEPINEWILNFEEFNKTEKINYSYWWLKTLAYLCYPVMPRFAMALWKNLSQTKQISGSTFFTEDTINAQNLDDVLFRKVNSTDLEKSLPPMKKAPL